MIIDCRNNFEMAEERVDSKVYDLKGIIELTQDTVCTKYLNTFRPYPHRPEPVMVQLWGIADWKHYMFCSDIVRDKVRSNDD